MRPELAALVVHDLKNSLVVLEARLDELAHRPARHPAREAHRLCTDMRSRFITFLTLYRGDDAMQAHCEDESPRVFLEGLTARIARPAGAAAVRLGSCEHAPLFWYFDFRLVRLAMEAALRNAWRFAHANVWLDAREEKGYLVLSVDDDGPGLGAVDPAAELSTGLGTELCRAVARAHGSSDRPGIVELFNRDEGGARFELWLA